jgi:hypothetical protein
MPELRGKADPILKAMNFGFFYNPAASTAAGNRGLIAGGFWDTPPPGCSQARDGAWFTCVHHDVSAWQGGDWPDDEQWLALAAADRLDESEPARNFTGTVTLELPNPGIAYLEIQPIPLGGPAGRQQDD